MSNLLEKASIVTTPTAYDNGKILSVKPNTSVGDFDFTRNSSATRVNSEGLIEDVQILSSNLVSNGDFSQEGSEQITNGDFENGSTGWNLDSSCTIELGKANFLSSTSNAPLYQSSPYFTIGKTYKITYTVSNYSAGRIIWNDFGAGAGNGIIRTANGTYTEYYLKVGTTTNFGFRTTFGFTGSIDNVSVKEVGQDWNLGASWSIGNNKATRLTSVNWGLDQTISSAVNGRTYRVTTEITDYTSGSLQLALGHTGTVNTIGSALGVYVNEFVWTGSSGSYIRFQGNFVGSISNITILEITEDTNLPRIDYTGGTGHWLFEPQSTNTVTYSEDFSQWIATSSPILTSGQLAPDGTLSATKISGTIGLSNIFLTSSSTTASRSIYARTVSGTGTAKLMSYFGNTNNLFTLTEEWQRFELTGSSASGGANFYIDFRSQQTLSEFIIWGAQSEELSFATSYIPTSGSTVTRLQDAAFGAGSSDLINSTEGVLYAEIAKFQDINDNYRLISMTNEASKSANNSVTIGFSNSNKFYLRIAVNGVSILSSTSILATKNQYYKVAIKFNALGDNAVWIDGIEVLSNTTSFTYPVIMDNLSFNYNGNGSLPFYGKTKCVAVFKEALTDAELTCLTTI